MLLIHLFFICQCWMICHHDIHKHIWKKIYGSNLNKIFWYSLSLIAVRNYAMVICHDFMIILFLSFWTMWWPFKGPCGIKSFKISTVYDVWFSRYHPSHLMIIPDFALVLVFLNFLWAVYMFLCCWKNKPTATPDTFWNHKQITVFGFM